ncbi:hypothetical protein [Acetivibrio ethanolgignens]|uniref:Chemotaxis protein n=1 Tax=Acetivibrio ethanolgignens TaxID=290052 RepID=A0A0V8QCF1_9FIRM|nr:hypothetical protein [Acetivibrio ethanolgignens]KSV58273.1 hypothetical protein ASU35_13500 [Acetivibrio ethanolgignens]
MADIYDVEVTSKLQGVVEMFESELFSTMRAGVNNCLEYGQSTGSAKLVAAAEAGIEGTEQMISVFTELCDNARKYIDIVNKTDQAFN